MRKKILALDIETAPDIAMLWTLRTKGFISPKNIVQDGYILSFAARWVGSKEMVFARSCDGHTDMLRKIHAMLEEADAVVHFNGKRFDVPTLNKEFLLHGFKPYSHIVQIDLFPMVKRTFKFPSNSLEYVATRLRIGRKSKHKGIEMWWQCMNHDSIAAPTFWRQMEKYNKQDVVLVEKLFRKLKPWFPMTFGYKRINEWISGHRSKL